MMRRVRTWIAAAALVPALSACTGQSKETPKDTGPQPRIEKTVTKDGVEMTTTIMPK